MNKIIHKLCEQCEKPIPPKRLELVPTAIFCVQCKSKNDDFKFKMKTVGFSDEPTIARNKEKWNVLKKQKKNSDI